MKSALAGFFSLKKDVTGDRPLSRNKKQLRFAPIYIIIINEQYMEVRL
jgi:hypothetical protein